MSSRLTVYNSRDGKDGFIPGLEDSGKDEKPNYVLSISGGKDSTAMMLEMLDRGEEIHSAVFFDTGWEFPEMHEHIEKLENFTGVKIWKLHSTLPFNYWLSARPIKRTKGDNKGKYYRIGNSWPSMSRRWCTQKKVDAINLFASPIKNCCHCIGYAKDETHRNKLKLKQSHCYPLQDYGITESEALQICYRRGFDWGGLYKHFKRVSCFCCPLQGLNELRTLRKHFPSLWQRMIDMDKSIPVNLGFKDYTTVQDLEKRFENEEILAGLPGLNKRAKEK